MSLPEDFGVTPRRRDIEAAVALLRRRWPWFVAFGSLGVVFGIAALALTSAATIASVYMIALFIIIVGGAEITLGVNAHLWSSRLLLVSVGLLYIVAGSFALANPLTGAAGFTLLLGTALFATGLARIVFAARLPDGPSAFVVVAGGLTTLLGMLILFDWPENSAFVLGIFLGVDLLFYGASWIGFGLFLRGR